MLTVRKVDYFPTNPLNIINEEYYLLGEGRMGVNTYSLGKKGIFGIVEWTNDVNGYSSEYYIVLRSSLEEEPEYINDFNLVYSHWKED